MKSKVVALVHNTGRLTALTVLTVGFLSQPVQAQVINVQGKYAFGYESAVTRSSNTSELKDVANSRAAQQLVGFARQRLQNNFVFAGVGQTTQGSIRVTIPGATNQAFSLAFKIAVMPLKGIGRDGHSTATLVVTSYPSSAPGVMSVRLLTREFSHEFPGSGAWSPYEWVVAPDGTILETKTKKKQDAFPIYRGSLRILEAYAPAANTTLRNYLDISARDPIGTSVAATYDVTARPNGSHNATRALVTAQASLAASLLPDEYPTALVDASLNQGDLKILAKDKLAEIKQVLREALIKALKDSLVTALKAAFGALFGL